jgi:hypothetical protein
VRAAYTALVLGIVGGLGLATLVLPSKADRPTTVAAALALEAGGPDLDRRRAEAVAALVAACMTRLGIGWRPVVEPAPSIVDPDLGPIEWARRWGFGASTVVGPSTTGPPEGDRATPAQRAALHGDGSTPGCHWTASDEVYGLRDRHLRRLGPALAALDARIAADPAAIRAMAAWRACVGPVAGGLDLDRATLPGALLERYLGRAAAILPGANAIAGTAALQADERRVATIIAGCEVAFAGDRAAIAAGHEPAFVDAHREELRAIGAAIRAAEAALPTLPP